MDGFGRTSRAAKADRSTATTTATEAEGADLIVPKRPAAPFMKEHTMPLFVMRLAATPRKRTNPNRREGPQAEVAGHELDKA